MDDRARADEEELPPASRTRMDSDAEEHGQLDASDERLGMTNSENHIMARFKQPNAVDGSQWRDDRRVQSNYRSIAHGGHNAGNSGHHHNLHRNSHIIQKRQNWAARIPSNNEYSASTAAILGPASSNATTASTSTSPSKLHERQSSPPSSPIVSSPIISLPSDIRYTTITLTGYSPVLDPPTSADTSRSPISTLPPPTTSRRRRPTLNRTITTAHSGARTALSRTRSFTPTSSATLPYPADPPPQSQSPAPFPPPRISNVVHICIARPPASDVDAPPVTFTSTVALPDGINRSIRLSQPPPTGRDSADKRTARSRDRMDAPDSNDNNGTPAVTVTDYNCQLTLPHFSRPTIISSSSTSLRDLSPSNGLTANPNSGDAVDTGPDSDDKVAFFATPGGKGTIAGISIASAILLLTFLLLYVWRTKKNNGANGPLPVSGHNRGSTSTFGDSSDNHIGGVCDANGLYLPHSPALDQHVPSSTDPEISQPDGTGPPGSFFVQRRSQPPSVRGTDTPPRVAHTSQLDAEVAARAISPLAMLQARPQAFIPPPPPPLSSRAQYVGEGAGSGKDDPSSGSSLGHDPFSDPSCTGHSGMTQYPGVAVALGDKLERRRSGYTSDTYRKRRSRPLSVRNPDSDETREQEGVESLYMDRTPGSGSSDAPYGIDNAPIPDSVGLEYYLGSAVPTPRGNIPFQDVASLSAMPQNTLIENRSSSETPRAPEEPPSAGWPAAPPAIQELCSEQEPSAYDGIMQDGQAGHSHSMPEFEPHETYAYPQPRAIVSTASSGLLSRSIHSASMQPSLPQNVHPAAVSNAASSNLSKAVEQGKSTNRQQRQSFASSDGASSRSSLWRAWEHNNRSWVNDGFETPNDVQDVQLGSNAGAVGGGNATSISGYFAWR